MARWIVWIGLEAPDVDAATRRVRLHLADVSTFERIQSRASYEVAQEEAQALRRRRPVPEEDAK